MRYSEKEKVISRIEKDVQEVNEFPDINCFISAYFQMYCVCGEYDDNSLDLSYQYKMLKEIEADENFINKLKFVLDRYV